ncbi:MAG: hypothetical protein M3N30_03390 [Bacteroidota bacterium]|nr:hypothetical protein [Bacteroidota bacterium]
MRKIFIVIVFALLAFSGQVMAQGCVAIRQMGGVTAISPFDTYNLSKGDFVIGTNYRFFHSWRHFVGTQEQPQRQITGGGHDANGVDHGDAVNIYSHAIDFNLSYGLTKRVQLNLTIPWVHNERSQVMKQTAPVADTFRYSVYAMGIGDIRMSVNYWIFDPAKAHKGNLMVGAGIKLPTGNYAATDNNVPQADGTRKNFVIMDQAIQPGDGGLGFSVELQGFTQLYKNVYGFVNGYYLFNPKESNGTYKSAAKPGLEGYNVYASPDQYFARAGFLTSVLKSKNLTFSLAGRLEGIPAYDAFGGQKAYRRPGYVVAVEPGISYRTGGHTFSLFVPYNFIKNRIQSAADIADQNLQNSKIGSQGQPVHVQGDAAFADYSISIGYSYRIAKKNKTSLATIPTF